jgi:hypothetical protein
MWRSCLSVSEASISSETIGQTFLTEHGMLLLKVVEQVRFSAILIHNKS